MDRYVDYRLYSPVHSIKETLMTLPECPYVDCKTADALNSTYFRELISTATSNGVLTGVHTPSNISLKIVKCSTKYMIVSNSIESVPPYLKVVAVQFLGSTRVYTKRTLTSIVDRLQRRVRWALLVNVNFQEQAYIKKPVQWFQKKRNHSVQIDSCLKVLKGLPSSSKRVGYIVETFYKKRHDLLQLFCCQMYGLSSHIDRPMENKLLNGKTPDFFEYGGDSVCLIGDVQVSGNPTLSRAQKKDKYQAATNALASSNKKVLGIYICCDEKLSNLASQKMSCPLPIIDDVYIGESWQTVLNVHETLRDKDGWAEAVRTAFRNDIKTEMFVEKVPMSSHTKRVVKGIEDGATIEDVKEALQNSMKDQNIFNKYKDNEIDWKETEKALDAMYSISKEYRRATRPSHFFPIPMDNIDDLSVITGKNCEQKMIRNFWQRCASLNDGFIDEMARQCINATSSDQDWKVFCGGKWIDDNNLLEEYHRLRSANNQSIIGKNKDKMSYEAWLRNKGYKRDSQPTSNRSEHSKVVRIKDSCLDQSVLKKSGVDFRRKHDNTRKYKERHSQDPDVSETVVDKFLRCLSSQDNYKCSNIGDMFKDVGSDIKELQAMKKDTMEEASELTGELAKVFGYKYLKHSSLAAEQLIHLGNRSMPSHFYSYFNTGIPNMMIIVTGGYRGFQSNTGKSYMVCGFTNKPEWVTSGMFGKVLCVKNGNTFFYRTRWLRLPGHRLEFIKDAYYSVLSSTISSLLRRHRGYRAKVLKSIFPLRILVSLCPSTGFITKLADMRYVIMSSMSTHTNFGKLITEKFAPPYHNHAEAWLITKIKRDAKRFGSEMLDPANVQVRVPHFTIDLARSSQSTGGYFNVGSFWGIHRLESMQDLLDELFLYVHTPKEPSNEFHEERNAIQTIEKFQAIFNNMTTDRQVGHMKNAADISKFLEESPQVGCCSIFVKSAVRSYTDKIGVDHGQCIAKACNEVLSDIQSTKAIIDDERSKIEPDKKTQLKSIDTIMESYPLTDLERKELVTLKKKISQAVVKERNKAKGKGSYHRRLKVHDMIVKYLKEGKYNLVAEAVSSIKSGRTVLADICIKAQYGGKREFYVMNMLSKILARVCETYYKGVCRASPTEMISIPGDNKFLHMQKLLDRMNITAIKTGKQLTYVNGDCTKWSAAETMASFVAMNEGMRNDDNSNFIDLLNEIFSKWADKLIQVPKRLLDRVVIGHMYENTFVKSTQNFLQGVFNYSSSYKADCINHYCKKLWAELYPDKDVITGHLVHSDDYVLVVCTDKKADFVSYRAFHKMCMKLGGITDSTKKTNCQYIFMEFISLIGFNSSMCYPTIKKTKEVTTTLPCDSFKQDSDFVCSRTGECMRIGCDHRSSYIFHRIHMYQLRKSYGLHPQGLNYIADPLNVPVELFGQSDMYPIYYQTCKGDPNNYRLIKYSGPGRDIVLKIYKFTKLMRERGHNCTELFSPKFIYNRYVGKVKDIRSKYCTHTPDEAFNYWRQNTIYQYIKPVDQEEYKLWCSMLYFSNSFIKAYMRDSRSVRMLRLASYVKNNCLSTMNSDEEAIFYKTLPTSKSMKTKVWMDHTMSIQDYISKVRNITKDKSDDDLLRLILKGDSMVLTIYDWVEQSKIVKTDARNTLSRVATRVPPNPQWIGSSTAPGILTLYLSDQNKFVKNYPDKNDDPTITTDANMFTTTFPSLAVNLLSNDVQIRSNAISQTFSILSNNRPSKQVVMSWSRNCPTISHFLKDSFGHFENSRTLNYVSSLTSIKCINPYTNKLMYNLSGKVSPPSLRLAVQKAGLLMIVSEGRLSESPVEMFKSVIHAETSRSLDNILRQRSGDHSFRSLTRLERQILAYYNLKYYKDDSFAQELLDEHNFYLYRFDNSGETRKGDKWTGICRITVMYRDCLLTVDYDHDRKSYKGVSDTPHFNTNRTMLVICWKLLGKIREHELENRINGSSPLPRHLICTGDYDGVRLCVARREWTKKSTNYFNIVYDPKYQQKRPYKQKIIGTQFMDFRAYNISVYRGKMKMFTINYSRLHDTEGYYCKQGTMIGRVNVEWLLTSMNLKDLVGGSSWTNSTLLDPIVILETDILISEKVKEARQAQDQKTVVLELKGLDVGDFLMFDALDIDDPGDVVDEVVDDTIIEDKTVGASMDVGSMGSIQVMEKSNDPYLYRKLRSLPDVSVDLIKSYFTNQFHNCYQIKILAVLRILSVRMGKSSDVQLRVLGSYIGAMKTISDTSVAPVSSTVFVKISGGSTIYYKRKIISKKLWHKHCNKFKEKGVIEIKGSPTPGLVVIGKPMEPDDSVITHLLENAIRQLFSNSKLVERVSTEVLADDDILDLLDFI